MRVFASALAALAVMTAVGQAAPFDAKTISADAKWVIYVDVDAVRDSKIVQKAFETCPVLKDQSGEHFDKIAEKFGVDLRTDFHGITLYGCDTDKDHGVAIVYAKVNRELLEEKVQKAADHKVVKRGAVAIHTWTQRMGPQSKTVAGAFYKSSAIVFASSAKRVEDAIAVLDGKSPGLTDPKSLLGGHLYPGSTLLARSIAMPPEAHHPIAQEVNAFRIAMGENKGKSFYRARIFMKTADAAKQVTAIVEGAKAMGELQFADNADVKKLVDGLQTTVKSKVVSVNWDASTDDVWTVVEKLAHKATEHMKGGAAKKTSGEQISRVGWACAR